MPRFAPLLLVLTVALAAPDPARALTPSPADWRDIVIYQVLTDRFADGNPANNAVEGAYDPAAGDRIHGGDFAGLTAKLDYIRQLGATGVWISPVVVNASAEYHGYAARDFFSIAPHFGTLAELRALVDAAHARGMVVIIDVVVNHMGDLIDSGDAGWPDYRYPGTYGLRWTNPNRRHAGFFDDLSRFHAHGSIGTYSDPEQVVGELFSLDDLRTEDPAVRAKLVEAAAFLIDSTDCDGFRMDTAKHVDMPFWNDWAPAVHAHAAARGKNSFFLYGEAFDGDDAKVGSYTGTRSGGNYKLDSMLYFPMYFTTSDVFRWTDFTGPALLSQRYAALGQYDPSSRERLVTFLDNHDVPRFIGYQGPADHDEAKLQAALGWLLTSRGVPAIYYGTEQGFDGGGDPWNREDMWDGAWDFGPSDGDNFDTARPLYRWTQSLLAARARHEALRRGTTAELVATSSAGLYVYRRQSPNDTVLVAVNTANAGMLHVLGASGWPAGTILGDAVEPGLRDSVEAGGTLRVRVPARGVRVYESIASRAAAAGLERLVVESVFPGHDQLLVDQFFALRIRFDREVRVNDVAGAFTISPPMAGVWQASGRDATFYPVTYWSAGQTYQWSLASSLVSQSGAPIAGRFEASFRHGNVSYGVVVPAGYEADRIASQGLSAPEAIVPAPGAGPLGLMISDTGLDRLFTLTPGGDYGHWLGDSRWTRALGVAASPSGGRTVVDATGVYEVDARRFAGLRIGGSATAATGALAWGPATYSGRLHLSDPGQNRVRQLTSANTYVTFATGIGGAQGMAFGVDAAGWGNDLFVADANLTSIGVNAVDGAGRIVQVTPVGVVSTVAQNPALLNGVVALAFDTGGRFGGHLYGADILNERIVQIRLDGSVSVFATGFKNLSGVNCLGFGGDGAMYVTDPGSGESYSNSSGTNPPQVFRISRSERTVDAPAPGVPGAAAFAAPAPNPSRGDVRLGFALARPGEVSLEIFDVAGRRVRTLARGSRAAGEHACRWDGRDGDGRRAGAGLYLARLVAGGETLTRRIVRLP